jgi:hypothetical protein
MHTRLELGPNFCIIKHSQINKLSPSKSGKNKGLNDRKCCSRKGQTEYLHEKSSFYVFMRSLQPLIFCLNTLFTDQWVYLLLKEQ